MKRITLIVGHYGSGKTEFSVNHVINLKKQYDKVAILDMDIANPYFRSRERQEFLEVPVRVEYRPTERCRTLLPILEALSDWAEADMK